LPPAAALLGFWELALLLEPRQVQQSKPLRFDAFTSFETSPVSALVEQLFSGQRHRVEQRLAHVTIRGHFAAHRVPTLRRFLKSYAGRAGICSDDVKPELTLEKRQQLMEAHLDLKAFPGVPPALKSLQDVGIKLAFLSNMAPHMLESATKSSARWNF
jgi:2-haloacid dehalogenase